MARMLRSTVLLIVIGVIGLSVVVVRSRQDAQAQQALACRVDYTITSQWAGGFQGSVTVANTGTSVINDWAVAWSFPNGQSITQLWNARYTQNGATVAATHLDWNSSIPAGGTQSFGFLANWSGTNSVPAAFTVNGTPCGAAPVPTSTRTATATRAATATRVPATATRAATPTRVIPTATRTPAPTGTPVSGFFDDMNSYTTGLFHKADGWTNGDPFNVGWRADHVTFADSIMTLRLDTQSCPSGCSSRPYAAAEYRTNTNYGYGRYEGRFKAAKGSGIVAGSLFTYTGPSDNQPWDEIDIEILGKDTTKMQVNYYTNGVGGHETMINLGFDAAAGFHTYAFEWTPQSIRWYVDGVLVHTENGSRGPLPTHPSKLMMNLWAGIGVDSWLGPFSYTAPLAYQVDWVRYTPLP